MNKYDMNLDVIKEYVVFYVQLKTTIMFEFL